MIPSFDLTGRVIVVTGGAGFLGRQHCDAIELMGGCVFVLERITNQSRYICDITNRSEVEGACREILRRHGRIDGLINNAANNPKVEGGGKFPDFEHFPQKMWDDDIAVGLTGAMNCTAVFGAHMARNGGGVILNIASELAIIGPDQRLYDNGPKPVSYSVVKAGLLGLTRYTATYWPGLVRCNALLPGGVENGQPPEFLERINKLNPMGRMARPDEYAGTVAWLMSDASSYVNGAFISADGGRTAW